MLTLSASAVNNKTQCFRLI